MRRNNRPRRMITLYVPEPRWFQYLGEDRRLPTGVPEEHGLISREASFANIRDQRSEGLSRVRMIDEKSFAARREHLRLARCIRRDPVSLADASIIDLQLAIEIAHVVDAANDSRHGAPDLVGRIVRAHRDDARIEPHDRCASDESGLRS